MSRSPRALLISAPWRTPNDSNVGMATLRTILNQAGLPTDTLHGTLLFPRTEGNEYVRLIYSGFYFAPLLHPEVPRDEWIEHILGMYLDHYNLHGIRLPRSEATLAALGLDEEEIRRGVLEDMESARVCVDRCVEHTLAGGYDVVGFSCTFEPQVPAALVIATRLKEARPDIRTIIGGASCFGPPSAQILKWCPAIDTVCHCEGERVIVPLVQALRGHGRLDQVPGIVWREGGQIRRTPAPPMLHDLDELPIPDYDAFVDQLERSEYRGQIRLYFETSRGCWWGAKHLCTFCGLNTDSLAYRKKSSERAYQEIRTLYEKYPQVHVLQATDNILDMTHMREVLPRLRDMPRRLGEPLRLFYETKSNLRREHVRALADAGVRWLQPGIESFSDEILELMDKGATGIGQVQTLKWLDEDGIEPLYNMLVLNPGETAEAYRSMRRMLPSLTHLPAPYVFAIWLERYSPYYNQPELHGISNIRAASHYKALCRTPGVDLDDLAYVFDYDHEFLQDEELRAEMRAFVEEVDAWAEGYRADSLVYVDDAEQVRIIDRRTSPDAQHRLSGLALEVFRYLDRARPLAAIRRRFEDVPDEALDALLATWSHRLWLCRDDSERHVVVIPRRNLTSVANQARKKAGFRRQDQRGSQPAA